MSYSLNNPLRILRCPREGPYTFAVGHLALGYITGKATSKLFNVNVNIPLLFVASVISDIDIIIGLQHRGPTHSLVFLSILFIPAFAIYGKKATPYFIAVIQHSIPSDYLTGGGIQLLWPITLNWYGMGFQITSLTNVSIELASFLTSMAIMLQTRDAWILFQHHPSNLLLAIPIFTVLLPTLISFPLSVPIELVIPHLIYLAIFAVSIFIDLKARLKTKTNN